ncbi:MAG: vWA domain-containing protein, partial [Planctomycetota bacterium]|nr:vWA domain-containing protein [Planctomycetota bacterium]
MTLSVALAGGLSLAVCGLVCVRTASPAARWSALLVALAFAAIAAMADQTVARAVPPRPQSVELVGDAEARRTGVLRAAARAGPRVQELSLRWAGGLPSPAPSAAIGAQSAALTPMPFAPDDVRIRVASRAEVERPTALELEVAGLERELSGELVVRSLDGDILRQEVFLGAGAVEVAFTPTRLGDHEAVLEVAVGAHRVTASGSFTVAPPREVLVVEPSGVVASALRAQGVRVREAAQWPLDWRKHQRVVLGRKLFGPQERALAEAVRDGVGVFVLAAAFGPEGSALRELLPVRPLPVRAADSAGTGGGVTSDESAVPPPPPELPRPDRIGDTSGAAPISEEPVEVDKHAIAMVLVVDRSASMGTMLADGMSKMAYARTSALRTAQALGEGDRVGLVTFGDQGAGRIDLPLTDAAEREVVERGIEKLVERQEWTFLLSGLRS